MCGLTHQNVVQKHEIKQENTYNMNESEFSIETMKSTQIMIDSTLCIKHQAHLSC